MLPLNKLIKCDGKKPEEMNWVQFVNGTAANHGSLSVAISFVLPSAQKYPCHAAEKWKYFLSLMVRISPLPSSTQSPPIFFILLHWVFGSVLWRLHVVSGDQSEPSPLVVPVQTAGRCAGGGRCPSLCSVLVNIRKDIKCQACFARKLTNLFDFYLILNWRMGLRCKH